ncbi:efflux transporter outer membrane subunit [Pararhizobium sp. YC-54]|uniref:efflux transporter outer membrane subunit n=1 Tax=Pararhizobium sp. YC-54 TaxID=2986920 RepID=UPI0021F7007E|nr:efflux transporter outer membrane subunit [Pararhizobium sp. YC-54]MCV9999557.1 efflux transporter outer membrane subunit [Pararhizobium sp. YC-54]
MAYSRTLLPLMAILLSSCVAGPDHQPPETALPSKYSDAKAQEIGDVRFNRWWESFHDKRLTALVEQGTSQNLDVLQAMERIQAAQANVITAGAGRLPQVDAGAEATLAGTDGSFLRNGTSTKTASANIGASWLLDLFGEYRRSVESANASLDAAYNDVGVARLAYLSDLAASYIDARFYQEALVQTRISLASRRETLKLTEDTRQAGSASSLDVVQAEGLVNQTLAELPPLETGFHQAANHIATVLGLPAASITDSLVKGAAQPVARYSTKTGVPADLIRNRPDIRKAERLLATATAEIGVAEAQLYPSITLGGTISGGRLVTNTASGGLTGWSFGPALNVPIFNGGALKANVEIAKSAAAQQYLAWKQTVLNAVEEVENALVALHRDAQTAAAQRRVVQSYEQALSLARESYRGGATTLLDVLDAERNVSIGRLSLAQAIRKLALDYVALNVAIGSGSEVSPDTAATPPAKS